MRASVIIKTRDEADRLRLTLASLARQTAPAEIVVVNDGSRDHTNSVLRGAAGALDLIHIDHALPRGRPAAANAGAARASGDLLIFLDGDTLASPDFVAAHLVLHEAAGANRLIGRGETRHLRCTRFFADPESGTPQPGQEARLAQLGTAELARMRVGLADVRGDFAAVEARASPGIYPGAGPRRLYELEMAALRAARDCGVLWAAASGANQSVGREAFLAAGGFDVRLDINAHRELALRLCRRGLRMAATPARSYHLTHRNGWRDPLTYPDWEAIFYAAHKLPEVALLPVFWASLASPPPFAPAHRINSLPELAAAARRCRGITGLAAVRDAHFAVAR